MKSLLHSTMIGLGLAIGAMVATPYLYANTGETAGQYISSSALTAKVKSALVATQGLDSNDINVTTVNDVVTLQGVVDNKAQAELADRVASGVSGVVGVNNKLTVQN